MVALKMLMLPSVDDTDSKDDPYQFNTDMPSINDIDSKQMIHIEMPSINDTDSKKDDPY